jgi:predicted dithiol-disulfide oxidoreductase (DUF899 family)
MIKNEIMHPIIVRQDEWLTAARKTLLEHEKESRRIAISLMLSDAGYRWSSLRRSE